MFSGTTKRLAVTRQRAAGQLGLPARSRKVLDVRIEPGCPGGGGGGGRRFVFRGEGNREPGKEAGDVVVHLLEREHPVFARFGTDLSMRIDLHIREALCGFRRVIT